MLIQVEEKAQGWRALAVYANGDEVLLFVGRSATQVRAGFEDSFKEQLVEDEQESVVRIRLQQWQGAPDAGKWHDKSDLKNPLVKAKEKLERVAA
jgi:hypothetical protein